MVPRQLLSMSEREKATERLNTLFFNPIIYTSLSLSSMVCHVNQQGGFASCFLISDQKNGRFAAKVIQKSELHTAKARHKVT